MWLLLSLGQFTVKLDRHQPRQTKNIKINNKNTTAPALPVCHYLFKTTYFCKFTLQKLSSKINRMLVWKTKKETSHRILKRCLILIKKSLQIAATHTSNNLDDRTHPVSNFTKKILPRVEIKMFRVWQQKTMQTKKSFELLYTLKVKKYYLIEKKKKYGSSYEIAIISSFQNLYITNTYG